MTVRRGNSEDSGTVRRRTVTVRRGNCEDREL